MKRVRFSIESEVQLNQLHDKWTQRYNNSEQGRLAALAELQAIPEYLRKEPIPIDNTPYPVR